MPYIKQTWADGSGGGTPVNAERLNHIEDGIEAIDLAVVAAADVTFAPAGTISATDVQSALEELDNDLAGAQDDANTAITDIATHLSDTSDAHDASAISFVPAGTIASTTVQEAIEELDATVAGGPGGASDPYGLLSDPAAIAADEFDDGTVHADWAITQPAGGTITANEGNHKLVLSCTATTDFGLFLRPLSTFGGAWSSGVTILESAWTLPRGVTSTTRSNFCVTDGTTLGSNAAQINLSSAGSAPVFLYQFLGNASNPFGGGYTDCGNWYDEIRARIVSSGSGTLVTQVSLNGNDWINFGTTMTIGFTPTHVGFLFGANNGQNLFSSDYVRRIA